MHVKEIVKKYLEENGFDGLYCEDCGCDKNDLISCDEYCGFCSPGYRHKCPKGHEADYVISPSKESPFDEE